MHKNKRSNITGRFIMIMSSLSICVLVLNINSLQNILMLALVSHPREILYIGIFICFKFYLGVKMGSFVKHSMQLIDPF